MRAHRPPFIDIQRATFERGSSCSSNSNSDTRLVAQYDDDLLLLGATALGGAAFCRVGQMGQVLE